jgi:hypothetical protein
LLPPPLAAAERIQAFTNTLANAVSTAGILGSSEAARYWAYHLSRSGFFMLQGLAGLLASRNAVGRSGGGDSPAVNRFEAVFRQARQCTGSGGRQAVQCSACSAGGWHNSACRGGGKLSGRCDMLSKLTALPPPWLFHLAAGVAGWAL